MTRARALLLALVGLALPVGLALGVYLASAGSLAAVPTVVEAPPKVARAATTERGPSQTTTDPTTTAGDDDRFDDLPGKCDDPDHRLDPDCDPRTAEDDDSRGHGAGLDSATPRQAGTTMRAGTKREAATTRAARSRAGTTSRSVPARATTTSSKSTKGARLPLLYPCLESLHSARGRAFPGSS